MKEIQSDGIPFYIVDVFTEFKYGGNQLAVVVSNNKMPATTMQKIANEMNYTNFYSQSRINVCRASNNRYCVYFTTKIH